MERQYAVNIIIDGKHYYAAQNEYTEEVTLEDYECQGFSEECAEDVKSVLEKMYPNAEITIEEV